MEERQVDLTSLLLYFSVNWTAGEKVWMEGRQVDLTISCRPEATSSRQTLTWSGRPDVFNFYFFLLDQPEKSWMEGRQVDLNRHR
jgi:hypothetical protein